MEPASIRPGVGRLAWASALLVALAWQGPCPAAAQATSGGEGVLETLHLKARLAPAPPFVADRPGGATTAFIPTGRTGAPRPVKPMTAAELAAATADLDAARERQQRRAGRKPATVPVKPPTATPSSGR